MTFSPRLHDTCIGMEIFPGNPCRCCCAGCLDNCSAHNPDHGACHKPKRYWWYERDQWDWKWWQFVYFGGDEFCNPTIVLRLWKPLVFVSTRELRDETCGECLGMALGEWAK